MALDPVPLDAVTGHFGIQHLPQVGILDRGLAGRAPAAGFPAGDPLADAFLHVLRVGVDVDVARTLEAAQRFDHGLQFHAVVGGVRRAAEQFFFLPLTAQQGTPATGAGVALAGAVGKYFDVVFSGHESLFG